MGFIVPIAMALMSYLSSRKAGHLQDQQSQNLQQQNQEIQYQQQRRAQADPMLNAILHLSAGMLPTYQQGQQGIANWGGFGAGGAGGAGMFGTAQNGNMFQLGQNGLPLGTAQRPYTTGPPTGQMYPHY